MTRTILITAAAFAATLQAQNNFQNSGWLGAASNPGVGRQPDGQSGPVTGKPFSGVETRTTKQVLSDGTPVNKTSVSRIFRDSEGRMRSESGSHAMLFDAPSHINYTINPKTCSMQTVGEDASIIIAATESGTSWSSHSGTTRPSTNPAPNPNLVVEDLGVQVINGVNAEGKRQTLTIPAKNLGTDHDIKVVNERWYSESLGILVKSSNVDPRFGSTTYELTEINQSNPDPSLFSAPSGCSERQNPAMRPSSRQ